MKKKLQPLFVDPLNQNVRSFVKGLWVRSYWSKTLVIVTISLLVVSGSGFIIFGLAFFVLTVLEIIKEIKSYWWPAVEAVAFNSSIEIMDGAPSVNITDGDPGYPDQYIVQVDY